MRRSKYGNKKPIVNGIQFDSKKEANYYQELILLQKAGIIKGFDRQVKFELIPKYKSADGRNVRAMNYIADFVVVTNDNRTEVIDVKGYRTKEYLLKKKLFDYIYGQRGYFIKEV